ncbi:Polysaccharide deacetylase [Pseudarthrobacter equi]|uniref:Polysaccharide deacetylase n=2 Tax=Pseudarthrobacter equi TaxID=728066 RepID=A0A1H1V4S0_9MICC|nr:polysaccharide deacetylase family protein [Pseudarthrobacter equi]SDS79738.1 Polysaccharide deacetylase [Pseudarthrobacter equi]
MQRAPKGQPLQKAPPPARSRWSIPTFAGRQLREKFKTGRAAATAAGTTLLVLSTFISTVALAPAANAAELVTVSLTFDDAHLNQVAAADYMNSKGLKGTFYVPSGYLNSDSSHMNTAQALALQTAGNEIGGHSVTHADLAFADTGEVTRQICNDRTSLTGLGFRVTSFAYPYASSTPAIENIANTCGYNSARGLGDIASHIAGSETFPLAETMPPADPFLTKAPDQADSTWTLQNLKDLTLKAEPGGGWIQYTFHHIGVATEPLSVTTENFRALIDFLAAEQSAGRVIVKTVDQVIGGAVKTNGAGPQPPAPLTSGNLIRNPGFETAGPIAGDAPACWVPGGYGINTYTYSTVAAAHTGTAAQQLVMSSYQSGNAKILPPLDTGQCTPTVTPGQRYTMSGWYNSTAQTQFELYYRLGTGNWQYWTSSPFFASSASFTQVSYTSPPVPAGATAMSMSLTLVSTGTLVTDDYSLTKAVLDPGAFQPMTPVRLLDTRTSGGPVAPRGTVSFQVGGASGIPASVAAVTFNLTVTNPTSNGFVTAYASGTTRPNASNLNYDTGQTVPNSVTVPVGADGKVTLYSESAGTANLIADVSGYYAAGTAVANGSFKAVAPARFLDTRNTGTPVAPKGTVSFQVGGNSGIPAGVSAVTFNLTVANSTSNGVVTAFASGTSVPTASNLNYDRGQIVPNRVTVPVGADGKVSLYNDSAGTAHLIADVSGYYLAGIVSLPGMFQAITPNRFLDTRSGNPVGANGTISVQVGSVGGVPATASATIFNLTVANPTRNGFVTAYPSGASLPNASNVNYAAGQIVPNSVTVPLGADGKVNLTNSSTGTTHLIADVSGYFL